MMLSAKLEIMTILAENRFAFISVYIAWVYAGNSLFNHIAHLGMLDLMIDFMCVHTSK